MPKYEDARVIDVILDFRGPYDGENLDDYLEAVFHHTVKDCPDLGDDQFCFCFDAIWHDVLRPGETKHPLARPWTLSIKNSMPLACAQGVALGNSRQAA